jgi:hypothetical protein
MESQPINIIDIISAVARVTAAMGTVIVAILAIWGDKVRARIAGPKLVLQLRDTQGNLTYSEGEKGTIRYLAYYHVMVVNKRKWSPAKNVRILVTRIEKRLPDGSFHPEPLPIPLQLTWAHPQFHELFPTISDTDTCDLGYLAEDERRFKLSLYVVPNSFSGYVRPNESLRVSISAVAHNFVSKTPLVLEISWDGAWNEYMDTLSRHLVVKQLEPSS